MDKKRITTIALRYGGIASAVLGAQDAYSQVNYRDIPDTTLNANGQSYDLNLDLDTLGLVDFRIIQYVDTTQFNISGAFIRSRQGTRNQVVGLDYANYHYPFKLDLGQEIGPDTVFKGTGGPVSEGQLALEINDTTYPNDQFKGGVQDGFIGLRLERRVNDTNRIHYGWMRVDVAQDLESLTIKDVAWQEQADSSIRAGEGSPLLDRSELDLEPSAQLWQSDSRLWVRLPENTRENWTVVISDMAGRELQRQELSATEQRQSLPLTDLPSGIAVARLQAGHHQRQSIKVVVY